ncbi:MAG: Gfo/Idh/MocA family oxidoreductase [Caldilinea sp.]|nr:Gfo/Idh/MocA family oxidoreductase [Caldilinea sp.]MDW8439958.1 Gfo/Idh/MocA family oxidoreductase [Caldilineaceae bacterium]
MSKLRIGVIGAGGIGEAHLRAYAAWPELCEIVAVADIDFAIAQMKASRYRAAAFDDYRLMLEQCRLDAVSICTPPKWHLPIALDVAERGIACLCEKPPARTLAETEAIVAAFERSGAILQFAFCHRFHEPVRQVKELIDAGKLGKIVQLYNRFGFRFERAATSWFTDPEIAGGGVLIDTLVHSIDIFRMFAGEIDRIDAAVSTTLPISVEDTASIQVIGHSGVIGSLNCSWVTPVSEAEIRVWGTEGEVIIDYATNAGARYRLIGDSEWTVLAATAPDRFVLQAAHFLNCVRSLQSPLVGAADGLAVMRAIEAAYRSAGRK